MNFPLLKVVEAQPDPELNAVKTTEDVLARLKLERVGLSERAGQIASVLSKLGAAEDCEREAQAALGELGLAEVLSVKDWAATGCVGPAPSPDMTKRDALNRTLGPSNGEQRGDAMRGGRGSSKARGARRFRRNCRLSPNGLKPLRSTGLRKSSRTSSPAS